ncbi:uncharacterized protein TM35_000023840 [Trypanosoma theileri]|uniref:Surface protein TolT n=1 Tax=Trypanosoma theileri TaxID=67003 RepID=A0A1X0P862_9TRYP|nr:uncharacterized protein TM35_000023840 [Trypanosoma theileri]ORC93058.1 hypothetical protein TM35_000023840 [Trypanosoma theileri]
MSMLSCRVLCLLAIVLCYVGVTHADPASGGKLEFVKEAQEKATETLKLKAECEEATKEATAAAHAAQLFAEETKANLEKIAADPKEVEKTKIEGLKFIENAKKAAEKAKKVRDETITSKDDTESKAFFAKMLAGVTDQQPEIAAAMKAADAAQDAITNANDAIDVANVHANNVESVLRKLDDAVAAAEKKKEEKQVETQAQQQTNETSLGEQQGHTEGNKTEQTQEAQSSSSSSHSSDAPDVRETSAIPLPTNATITNGITQNDGSSSPALLRVPLLLLLLSVLGCMAVC